MPLREYHCRSCGLVFEELVSGTPKVVMPCSGCGTSAELQVSAASVNSSRNPSFATDKTDVVVGAKAEQAWGQYEIMRKVRAPLKSRSPHGMTIDASAGHVRSMTKPELDRRRTLLKSINSAE